MITVPGSTNKKFVPLGGLDKVEGSDSGTGNLVLAVFFAAEVKYQADFFLQETD